MKKNIFPAAIIVTGLISLAFSLVIFIGYNYVVWGGQTRTDEWGQFGDFFGGVFGTIISFVTVYYVYKAFVNQTNDVERNEIERRFFLMIDLYKKNVLELEVDHPMLASGRKSIDIIIEKFVSIFEDVKSFRQRVDTNYSLAEQYADLRFSYELLYFGFPNLFELWRERAEFFELILDTQPDDSFLETLRNSKIERERFIVYLYDNTLAEFRGRSKGEVWLESDNALFNGYHNQLGHYFRHLFNMVQYINKQKSLSSEEKYDYIKVLRTQLTNNEQKLIFLNAFFKYGDTWEFKYRKFDMNISNKNESAALITKFQLIKNLPGGEVFKGITARTFFKDISFEEPL